MTGFAEQLAKLPPMLAAHVQLTLLALAIGIAVSLPLGIAASRRPRLERVSLGIASVAQTIPGLALMALMVPMLGALGPAFESIGWIAPPSIGFLPAVIALSLYSVLPMLRNTVTGIAGVDPALREAARGVGMNPFEVLWHVELPLALPTIVAGGGYRHQAHTVLEKPTPLCNLYLELLHKHNVDAGSFGSSTKEMGLLHG